MENKKIKIIGFGDTGFNCIEKMLNMNTIGVEFIEISTNRADINNLEYIAKNCNKEQFIKTLLIGEKNTKGLGDILINKNYIEDSIEKILKESRKDLITFLKKELKDTEVVFFISGIINAKSDLIVPLIEKEIRKLNIYVIGLIEKNSISIRKWMEPRIPKIIEDNKKSNNITIIIDCIKNQNIQFLDTFQKIYNKICNIILELTDKLLKEKELYLNELDKFIVENKKKIKTDEFVLEEWYVSKN